MHKLLIVLAALTACKSKNGASRGKQELDPQSDYAKLRPAIVAAVTAFPADPAGLPRCGPQADNVVTMERGSVAGRFKLAPPPVAAAVKWRPSLQTSNDHHMEVLEVGQDYELDHAHTSALKVSYGWFATITRIALYQWSSSKEPQLTNCMDDPASPGSLQHKTCDLVPGALVGDVVLFDGTGAPQCATRLAITGPTVASSLTGSIGEGMAELFRSRAERLFPTGHVAFQDAPKDDPHYRVEIDGKVVAEPER